MESTADTEKKLFEPDREIHFILKIFRKKEGKSSRKAVEPACRAWDYGVDNEKFVDRLLKSSLLDWVK